jgi:hypothetical protein
VIYLLAFVVLVLAVARATRVIVIDEVATPLRKWVFARFGPEGRMAKLVRCYWCCGFWISLLGCALVHAYAHAFAGHRWHTWLLLPVTTFAVAYGASWVLDKEHVDGI